MTPEVLQKIATRNKNLEKWVAPQATNGALLRGEAACSKVQSTKFIKLHFHYILKNDGTGNFRANDDGYVGTSYHKSGVTGYTWSQDIVNGANAKMEVNFKNFLPNPNNTPIVPKRVKYLLGSVTFHCSDYWYNANNSGIFSGWDVDAAYGGQDRGQSVHVYMIVHNGTNIAGEAADIPNATSVYPWLALRMNTWLIQTYSNPYATPDGMHGHLLNHEMGHLLGLYHDDCCDDCTDTGDHPNCFGYIPSDPICGSWLNISNNVMMASGNPWQEALTPCQIDRMQTRLLGNLSSYVEQCVQECSPATPSFTLSSSTICSSPSRTVTIYPNNNAANSTKWKVKVTKPNGQVFDNVWQTGSVPSSINLNTTLGMNFSTVGNYTITLYGDNFPNCPGEVIWVESLTVISSTDPQCRKGGGILRMAGIVTPNPSQGSFSINYELTQTSDISMMLIDPIGNLVKMLLPMGKQPVGVIQKDFQMNLQPGLYQILINENGVVEKFPLTIAR
jgi:hypothetical protein